MRVATVIATTIALGFGVAACGGSSEPPTPEAEQQAVVAFNAITPKMAALFKKASDAAEGGDEGQACELVREARDAWDDVSDDVDMLRRTPRWDSTYREDVEYNEEYLDKIGC